ncbi:MAG: DUF3576 domain-containing protein [Acetobacteraceae bacterium]
MTNRLLVLLSLASAVLLGSCGANSKPPEQLAGYFGPETAPQAGSVFGDRGLQFGVGKGVNRGGGDQGGSGIGVNAFLWRGALDTLSFMPLSSADPFGGTIITDWYSPPGTQGERFKVTAYILGRELRTDGLRVAIFRQTMDGGRWEDASVSPVTTGDIENKILDRARQLRAAQLASQ